VQPRVAQAWQQDPVFATSDPHRARPGANGGGLTPRNSRNVYNVRRRTITRHDRVTVMLSNPLQVRGAMATPTLVARARRVAAVALTALGVAVAMSACNLPFGLGLPTTRALESGAAGTLAAAKSLEITGSYTETGDRQSIDLQLVRPSTEHVVVSTANLQVEAIIIGHEAFFRGQKFLSDHLGSDTLSRKLVQAAGNAWWKGPAGDVQQLPDLTDGDRFRSTFLGPAVTQRSDHLTVGGLDAVELSGTRADVYISAVPPYRILRLHMKKGVVIDGISEGDLTFANFNRDFGIAAPGDVIDFSNLSTLPPIYFVVSVDASRCGSPCVVTALLKNLGGKSGARAPSMITFTMTATASGIVIGSCQAPVTPDVGYNTTTTVSCTIGYENGQQMNAAIVTATADNPGRG
jgi:hypothetical protein